MNHVPAPMTKVQLTTLLGDISSSVRAGDSFEGWIRWEIPNMGPGIPPPGPGHEFDVSGVYRVGNSMGQGSVVIVGELVE